jgi:hypothetical protein
MGGDEEAPMPDYTAVFRPSQVFQLEERRAVVHLTQLGFVNMPTGCPLAFDPFMCTEDDELDDEPFVAPGRYRVERSDAGGDLSWPLAVRLVLAEREATYWERHEETILVEAATIAFADASMVPALAATSADAIGDLLDACGEAGGVFKLGDGEVFALSTGADGGYQVSFGYDGDDHLVGTG